MFKTAFYFSLMLLLMFLGLVLSNSSYASEVVTFTLTDQKGKPLVNAVVTLRPNEGASIPSSSLTAMIDQIDNEYVPLVSVVPAGTSISFPNKDNILHHVYSFSEANTFDLPLYKGTPSEPVLFPKPGLVTLGCNIHDWMKAYVVVVDTPYFQITSSAGTAQIRELPIGEYELVIWHPRQREPYARKVDLQSSISESISISTKPQLRSRRNPSQQGERYN